MLSPKLFKTKKEKASLLLWEKLLTWSKLT